MADENVTSSVEHVAALDFDLTGVDKQFAELGKMVEAQGAALAQRFYKNAKLTVDIDVGGSGNGAAKKKIDETADYYVREITKSFATAKKQVMNSGSESSIVLEYLQKGMSGGSSTVGVSAKMLSTLKGYFEGTLKELSPYLKVRIKELGDETTIGIDKMMQEINATLEQRGMNPIDYTNDEEAFQKLREAVRAYRNELHDTMKGSSNYDSGMEQYLRKNSDVWENLSLEVQQYAENMKKAAVQNTEFTSGLGSMTGDQFKAYIKSAASAADQIARVSVKTDDAGKLISANVNYTDAWGNKFKEVYGWEKQAGDESEVIFKRLSAMSSTDPMAGVKESFKRASEEARSFATAYEQTKRQLESVQSFGLKTGDEDMAGQAKEELAVLEQLQTKMLATNELYKNNGKTAREVTEADKETLDEASRIAIQLGEQVKQRKNAADAASYEKKVAKEAAATEKARVDAESARYDAAKKVQSIYEQIVKLEQKQAGIEGVTPAVAEKTAEMKRQLEELLAQVTAEGQLNGVSKETLAKFNAQLAALRMQTTELEATNGAKLGSESMADGLLARSGKWFGAYQVWHMLRSAVTETADAVIDAEGQMAEISRVMNDASYNADEYRTSLYKLAEQYGQTFGDTAEIAAEWARAGYDVQDSQLATKDTLLALATADLDASSATTDLIAVSQQWGLELADLEGMIDRVNIASDRYPVTAQNLMDALSKVGNTARNAGMSIDETIASITAMSAATGASGDAVGNAFRSMISITNKPSNLKKLDAMGVDIYADKDTGTLKNYYQIIKSIGEAWQKSGSEGRAALEAQLAEQGLVNESIAEAIGQTENYTEHLTATTEDQRALTAAVANTYRSNYFQALLGNGGMAEDVLETLQESAGYSENEMTVWMDTLQAHLNTLKASLEELAVTSAENGLADFAKSCLDAANAVVQFTNKTGGLSTVFLAVFDVAMIAKGDKVIRLFGDVGTKATGLIGPLKELYSAFKQTAALEGYGAALKGLGTDFVGFIGPGGWIAIAATAVYAFSKAVDKAKSSVKDARDALYSRADALGDGSAEDAGINGILSKYEQYRAALENGEITEEKYKNKLIGLQNDLNALIGEQAEGVDLVNGKYDETKQKVEDLIGATGRYNNLIRQEAIDAANGVLSGGVSANGGGIGFDFGGNNLGSDALDVMRNKYRALYDEMKAAQPTGGDETKLDAELAWVLDEMAKLELAGKKDSTAYNVLAGAASDVNAAIEEQKAVLEKNGAALNGNADGAQNAADAMEDVGGSLMKAGDFYGALTDATAQADVAASGFSSNLSSLESALADVNLGNETSLNTMMELLNAYPALADAVVNENGVLSLNADAMEAVRQAQYNKMIAEQTAAIVTSQGAEWEAAHSGKLAELTNDLYSATDATARQAAQVALLNYVNQNATASTQDFSVAVAKMKVLFAQSNTAAQDLTKSAGTATTAAANASKAAQEAAKAEADALKEKKAAADEAFEAQKKQIDAAKKAYDEEADARVKALEKEKKAAEDSYQKQIDALNKLKDAESRNDAEEDYESKRADLVAQYEETRKKSSQDAISEGDDLLKEIAELDKDHARDLRDNAIDDRISQIEDEKDAVSDSYDAQIEAVKAAKEAQDAYYSDLAEKLSAAKEAQDEYYEKLIEAANKQASAAAEAAGGAAGAVVGAAGSAADAVSEGTRRTAKYLSGTIEEVAKYMQKTMGGSYENYVKFLTGMKNSGDSWAEYTTRQLGQLYSQWYNLQQLKQQQQEDIRVINDSKIDRFDARDSRMVKVKAPTSHAGSTVTKDGLVNLQAGEIVLNSMASDALAAVAEPMKQVFLQPDIVAGLKRIAARDTAIAARDTAGGGKATVEFNYNVGEQNFNDNADSDLAMAKLTRAVKRAL